jgi:hypothetical protein
MLTASCWLMDEAGPTRRLVAHHAVPSRLELSQSVVSESDRRHVVRGALARLGVAPMREI